MLANSVIAGKRKDMSKMLKRILFTIMITSIAIVITCGCGIARQPPPENSKRVEIYTVRPGDTLWQIAETYVDKNTYGPQYLPEYMEGIKANPANREIFADRSRQLQPGDKIQMVYWVKEKEPAARER